jgi:hypothetical protein
MTDSVPPPLPSEKQCCSSRFAGFLVGVVVGAVAVSAAATFYIQRERAKFNELLAFRDAGHAVQDLATGFGVNLPAGMKGNAKPESDAERVKALGDETVEDLRQGRLTAVYKLTTADYQKRVKREDFDKLLADVTNLRQIYTVPVQRESKVRKAAEGEGYEYYCSSGGNQFSGNVVFSLVFEPGDNGAWRIGQFEVTFAGR